jgi:hypothetical protein
MVTMLNIRSTGVPPVRPSFHSLPGFLPGLLLFLSHFFSPLLHAAEVTTTLEPKSVPAGEGANLTITITNGTPTVANKPEVPDLIIQGPNQGRQYRNINGVASSTVTLSYAIGSMTAGEYNIPPFTLTIDGAEVKTDSFTLKVTPSANQAPAGMAPGNASGNPPPSGPTLAAGETDFGFLTVEFADKKREHAWVGEIAPVRIKAWIPDGARANLNARIQPEGSSFTLHNLSERPQESREQNNGKNYHVVSWYGGLSALKGGRYAPDLTLKLNIAVPDPKGGRQSTGDPFMDQFLGRRMIQKEVTLHSKTDDSAKLEIRSLPTEGRPDNFAGAVGKFAFGRTNLPTTWKTGEPQQILTEVTGSGNFTLLKQPELLPAGPWKSYPGQNQFAAGDAAAFSGTTTFRFSQVARQAGNPTVHLSFSYFDPESGAYQTADSPPQSIQITGADLAPEPEPPATAAQPDKIKEPENPLAPLRTRDSATASLTPWAYTPAFRRFLTSLSLLLLAAFSWRGFQHVRQNPARLARAAHAQALRTALSEVDTHAGRGDVPRFFAAARRALQVRLAPQYQRPAHAITLADLTAQLSEDSPVVQFFREADLVEFSRPDPNAPQNLPNWRALLNRAMNALN